MAFRAEVILAIAEGLSNKAVAERLGARPATVSKWRGRFAQAGLSGLRDASRSGKPRQYQDEHERRILAALDEPPPAGYGRWDGGLLARHVGDISKHQIWRVLRRHEISLARRRSWCISTDPAFAQKAADIVGLAAARQRRGVFGRREAAHPGAGARPRLVEAAQWQSRDRVQPCLQTSRDDDLVRRPRYCYRLGQDRPLSAPPARRVPGFHEPPGCRTCRPGDPCDFGQSQYPQAQTRPLAGAAQERPFPFYPDPCLLAQSSGGVVFHSLRQSLGRCEFYLATPGSQ